MRIKTQVRPLAIFFRQQRTNHQIIQRGNGADFLTRLKISARQVIQPGSDQLSGKGGTNRQISLILKRLVQLLLQRNQILLIGFHLCLIFDPIFGNADLLGSNLGLQLNNFLIELFIGSNQNDLPLFDQIARLKRRTINIAPNFCDKPLGAGTKHLPLLSFQHPHCLIMNRETNQPDQDQHRSHHTQGKTGGAARLRCNSGSSST